MSFRDIGKVINKYNRQLAQNDSKQSDINKNNYSTKKNNRVKAYELFQNNESLINISIKLNISYIDIKKYWSEFLKLQNMYELSYLCDNHESELRQISYIYFYLEKINADPAKIASILNGVNKSLN